MSGCIRRLACRKRSAVQVDDVKDHHEGPIERRAGEAGITAPMFQIDARSRGGMQFVRIPPPGPFWMGSQHRILSSGVMRSPIIFLIFLTLFGSRDSQPIRISSPSSVNEPDVWRWLRSRLGALSGMGSRRSG